LSTFLTPPVQIYKWFNYSDSPYFGGNVLNWSPLLKKCQLGTQIRLSASIKSISLVFKKRC